MKTVYSPDHIGHSGHLELDGGRLLPGFEKPERAQFVLDRIEAANLGPVIAPTADGLEVAAKIHDSGYLTFLAKAHDLWLDAGYSGTALPMAWPTRGLRDDVAPKHVRGLLGYYSFDGGAGFVPGTYKAVTAAADCAASGADLLSAGDTSAFVLTRPPGHHAGRRFSGGYCYINNAGVAAQRLLDNGAKRVSILDVDYHHGNGTQEIFYDRADVQFISIHADPDYAFPYFLGRGDERGAGAGAGFNHNLPLPIGTDFHDWGGTLDRACRLIAEYGPDAIVVSLGLDTYEGDPISRFRLTRFDYPKVGARIAQLNRPTLFVLEGGYAVEAIGINAVGVLSGFLGA